MYIDLIVLLVLLIFVILNFNKVYSFVFFIAIVDITLRLLSFLKSNLPFKDITKYINSYLPNSLPDLINKYTGNWDIINLILTWLYVGIMIIFLYYCIKIFWKKKKI